jgi:hypothetical protein
MNSLLNPPPERELPRHEKHRTELLSIIDTELVAPRRRALVPLLAAAAVVTVIAGLAYGLPALRKDDAPSAGSEGIPALGVPYQTSDGAERLLHDGSQTVSLAKVGAVTSVVGRVANGWLVTTGEMAKPQKVGILTTAGNVEQRGPDGTATPVLSPDRSKLALVATVPGQGYRIIVLDVASGKQLATQPIAGHSLLSGWNKAGIWSLQVSGSDLSVWQPGEAPRPVTVKGIEALEVPGGATDRMVATIRRGQQACVQVLVTTQPGKLAVLREVCGGQAILYTELSPDGQVLAVPALKKAISVDDGHSVSLSGLPEQVMTTVFEDAKHFLALESLGVLDKMPYTPGKPKVQLDPQPAKVSQRLVRCDVVTGSCQQLLQRPASSNGLLISLGNS